MAIQPFIYIASLPRTGSTVLSEALTSYPYAFIFREPHLGKNIIRLHRNDVAFFKEKRINLEKFFRYPLWFAFLLRRFRRFGLPQQYMLNVFKNKLTPTLGVQQVGVKEIRNKGWENYVAAYPNMRVLITGRDPRDIYILLFYLWKRGVKRWDLPFKPDRVSKELLKEFNIQKQLMNQSQSMLVKYEDLCQDDALITTIKEFVNSPIPEIGEIGMFTKQHPLRNHEYQTHKEQFSTQSINRWKYEKDNGLLKESLETFELMAEYCSFWNY